MAYEEQESKRSRVVVQTPTSHREVVESESVRGPDRSGISGGTVGVIVVLAVALVTILVLLLLSGRQSDTTTDVAAQQQPAPVPQTTIIQQPAPQQQPPVIIQQPAPVQQAPVIVNPPATTGASSTGSQDGAIQLEIDKRISDDSTLSTLGITATVLDGKVTLVGSVKNEGLKADIERMVRRVKGVKNVDNQISVIP